MDIFRPSIVQHLNTFICYPRIRFSLHGLGFKSVAAKLLKGRKTKGVSNTILFLCNT